MTLALVGRERELGALEALIGAAAIGGGAVVVRGDAGIGKSVLLAAARETASAQALTCLATAGVQSETHLPFAGLQQLLHPLLDRTDELSAPQRSALEVAFGVSEGATAEPFLVALASLELLANAAADAPVLIVIEDAHWLDRPSADALAFVARRLDAEPIVLLAALREGWESPFAAHDLTALALAPLQASEAEALLAAHGEELGAYARARVLQEAGGNPLALVELPRALTAAGIDSARDLSSPLPLTIRLERAFTARALELPRATRSVLLVAAASDVGDLNVTLRAAAAVHGCDLPPDALEPALAARLITLDGSHLSFRHPLVRSAIYGAASFPDRRVAHAALAEVLADRPDRCIWHRAAASVGPDEAIATQLEAAALRARGRGATAVALSALERSSALTDDPACRARRLLLAGELAFELGGPELGKRFLREAEPLPLSTIERARLSLLRELFEDEALWMTGTACVASFVKIVDQLRADGEAELALSFLLAVAQRCWWANLEQETRRLVAAAARRMPATADEATLIAILAFADPVGQGAALLNRIERLDSGTGMDAAAIRLAGAAATAIGAFERSPGLLAASVDGLRAQGRLGLLSQALVSQAWAAVLLGNWSVAIPAAVEAGRLARETGQPRWAAAAQLAEATLAAVRGDEAEADRLAAEAERLLMPLSAHPTLAFVQLARGLGALSAGRHSDAYEHLRAMFDPADVAYHPFVSLWAIGDMVEAGMRGGHTEEVRALVATLEPLARASHAPLLQPGLAYARPLVCADDGAEALFEAGLAPGAIASGFYRARLLLAYGAWLRRQRRVAESRSPLRSARDAFDSLGAVPWGERARQELGAAGEASRTQRREAWDQLTPHELQIAQMAASGMSNREIGQKLYVSHRTVGTHLYRIFKKLGVASRGQLRDALEQAMQA